MCYIIEMKGEIMENIQVTLSENQVKHIMKHLGLTGKDNWLKVKAELAGFVKKAVLDKTRKLQ